MALLLLQPKYFALEPYCIIDDRKSTHCRDLEALATCCEHLKAYCHLIEAFRHWNDIQTPRIIQAKTDHFIKSVSPVKVKVKLFLCF